MISRGTANVGIRLMGSTVMTPVGTPWGLISLASVPRAIAMTRSTMPRICQSKKTLRWLEVANFEATSGAVTPMAMSPHPAGKAKPPGSIPAAYRTRNVNPAILQDCTKVNVRGFKDSANARNPAARENQSRNAPIGMSTARPRATGGRLGSVWNRWRADAVSANPNHAAMRPTVILPYVALFMTNLLVSWLGWQLPWLA